MLNYFSLFCRICLWPSLSLALLYVGVGSVSSTSMAQAQAQSQAQAQQKKTEKKGLRLPPEVEQEKNSSADVNEIFKSLDYPELQVVPRASDRLQFEAQNESDNKVLVHWPIILPSLATLYLGYSAKGEYKSDATQSEKDDADLSTNSAMAVGAFWVATSAFISWTKPYRTAINRVRKNRDENKRGELFRERIAEEALETQAKTMRILSNLAIVTNLAISISVGSQNDISDSQVAITALLAFTPWVFEHRYISAWDKHLEYKRKIYTPMSSLNFKFDDQSNRLSPLVSLRWDY